jgi:dihydroorotate dehydrogenase electron transfer subunit
MRDAFLMWLEGAEIAAAARPGQFVMVRCAEDMPLRRPLSFHQVEGDTFALLYAVVGPGTDWLSGRQPDEELDALGPLGNGFRVEQQTENLLLVAGGMGVAPLAFLAEDAVAQGKTVRLLYGTPAEERCFVPGSAEEIAATEDGSVGHCGLVTDLILQHADWADQVFACGPPAMYHDMARRRKELGLAGKPVQVSLEMRMGCGQGVCYSCTVKTQDGLKQVCKDGPVFDMDDVIWEELGRA